MNAHVYDGIWSDFTLEIVNIIAPYFVKLWTQSNQFKTY